MVSGLIGSIIGAGADIGLGLYNAHHSAKEARAADRRQYHYSIKAAKNLPSAQRQGLEAAGYNPMLALGDIGGASSLASHQGTTNLSIDGSSAKALGEFAEKLMVDKAKAEVDNIKANTQRTEAELGVFDAQKARLEAETSLAISQAERNDLAYGRDIVDTITGIAGTGASLYSAKSMSDVAKANTQTYEVRRDAKGRKVGEIQRVNHASGIPSVSNSANPNVKPNATPQVGSSGIPSVSNSANPNVKPNATPQVGSSARTAGRIAKSLAKALVFLPIVGAATEGVMPLVEEVKSNTRDDIQRNLRKHPMQYREKKGRSNFVPRFGY